LHLQSTGIDQGEAGILPGDIGEDAVAGGAGHIGHDGYSLARQAVKGVILVVNKWDLAVNQDMVESNRYIRKKLKFMSYAPVVYTSAKLGQGVDRVMPEAFEVYQERQKRIATTEVNSVVQRAVAAHNLPRKGKKQLKILYATQAEVNPPTFVFFVNDSTLIHFSYQHYLENKLRQSFGFDGTPLRFVFKTRGEQ